MKLSGSVTLPAAPAEVWSLLTDPGRIGPLLPGCERLDPIAPNRYQAVVKFGLGAISGKYTGTLQLAELKPHNSLALRFDGSGLAGFVKGEASIRLVSKGSSTEVGYSGEAQVGGMIAGVGQRLLEAAAGRIVRQFFDSAAQELQTADAASPEGSKHPATRGRASKKR